MQPLKTADNVIALVSRPPPPRRTYSVEVISERDVNGMVLIEGCVPRLAFDKFLAMLKTRDY